MPGLCLLESGGPVVGDLHLVAVDLEEPRQPTRQVRVIVDDEHPRGPVSPPVRALAPAWSAGERCHSPREADGELTPFSWPFTPGHDRSAMQLGELLDQRQADAQPSRQAFQRAVALHKELEYPGKLVGRDAGPGIANTDDDLISLAPGRQPDLSTALGVLGGVGKQVD